MSTYEKASDPFRKDEVKVRELIRHATPLGSFHIRQQGEFVPGDETSYALVRVIGWRDEDDRVFSDKPFSLHDAVVVSDGGVPTVRLINGRYDLSQGEAQFRLAR